MKPVEICVGESAWSLSRKLGAMEAILPALMKVLFGSGHYMGVDDPLDKNAIAVVATKFAFTPVYVEKIAEIDPRAQTSTNNPSPARIITITLEGRKPETGT